MRRNRTEILVAILEVCQNSEGLSHSKIGYKTRTNLALTYGAIKFLVEKHLLDMGSSRLCRAKVYRTTEEGRRLIQLYREVEKALATEARV